MSKEFSVTYPKSLRDEQKITILFGEVPKSAESVEFRALIDCDEFGDPAAIEIRGASESLGSAAIDRLRVRRFDSEIRFSYDEDSDIAVFGLPFSNGTRYLKSAPTSIFVTRSEEGLLLSLEFNLPIASD